MNLFAEIGKRLEQGQQLALVTVIRSEGSSPRKGGSRMVVLGDGSILGTIGGGTVEYRVIERAMVAIKQGKAELYRVHLTRELGMCCGGAMEFHIEPLELQPTLVLFGAGHVGKELCPVASQLGFQVIVVDEREMFITAERFPDAVRLIEDDPLDVLEALPYGPTVYFLIVTHLHRLDEALLRLLITRDYGYLGMIGSRAKVAKFLARLSARGISEADLNRARMPVGLSIGAETPAEIAVSIAAELVQIRREAEKGAQEGPHMTWRPEERKIS